MHLSEQELIRRQSLEEIKALGINPYPSELFEVNVTTKDIRENFETNKEAYQSVSIAGRLMSKRVKAGPCSISRPNPHWPVVA